MLRITGGKVYDPANGVDGVVKDVCIRDGKIVADVEGGRTLDAQDRVVVLEFDAHPEPMVKCSRLS
jgi:formylmethanofuran dehydrogenase subunit A